MAGGSAVTVIHGDSRRVVASMASRSVDSIVTDPPYELGMLGKAWDSSGVAFDVGLWAVSIPLLGGHLV
jgi:DNA modification methylase